MHIQPVILFMNPISLFYGRDIKRQARLNALAGKPLDPMNDVVFKTIFTGKDKDSREALRCLLSDCIHRPVQDVQIQNSEFLPEFIGGKTIRIDIHVTFNDGEQADIEIQVRNTEDDYKARALFYACKLLAGQAKQGKYYREIKRVYQITFLNCELSPLGTKVPRRYSFREETEYDQLNELVEIIFYEMPKLRRTAKACLSGKTDINSIPAEQKWCLYFMYRDNEKMKPVIESICRAVEGLMKADKAFKKSDRNYARWARALFRDKARMDYASDMDSAERKGHASGKAEGKVEGEAKGRHENRTEIIRRMKANGRPIEQIVEDTGLTAEEIEGIDNRE
jgi:predicted transposase/invertase (TIGR01784 family)